MVSSSRVALVVAVLLLIIATGCSNGDGNLQPLMEALDQSDYGSQSTYNHALWGIWEIQFDVPALKADAVPARELLAHFNVTNYLLPPACNDCLKVIVNSFNTTTRIMDVDVTLKNPTPMTGHDVRGILYTDDAGHDLISANGLTGLFDIPGGGNINPFNSFAKSSPNRAFAASAEYTEKYFVYIPIPPKYDAIKFAVDASWPGNCKEPYAITGFTQEKLYDAGGGQALIQVRVKDWQKDVNKVTLAAKAVTGVDFLQLYNIADDVWGVYIKNQNSVPPGDYPARLIATSTGSGSTALYDYATIKVDVWGIPSNPLDITPPWLNFTPQKVCYSNGYAYIAAGIHGIHVFDVSTPATPEWLQRFDTPDNAVGITTDGDYIFVAEEGAGLEIFEIGSSGTLSSVKLVDTPGNARDSAVVGGYAVVADFDAGVTIIDIDPIDTAAVVKTVNTATYVVDVATNAVGMSGGYIYAATADNKMQIIDTYPLGSAQVIKEVAVTGVGGGIATVCGFVYLANYPDGVVIIDASVPSTASIIKSIDSGSTTDLVYEGSYLYTTDGHTFSIIDIDPPASAVVTGQISNPGWTAGLCKAGNYAFVANRQLGLSVIDVSSTSSPSHITDALTPGEPEGAAAAGNYAYVANYDAGLQVIDVTTPSEAEIINGLIVPGRFNKVRLQAGYAYAASGDSGLNIFNIDSPPAAYLEKNVGITGFAKDVAVDGGYAYIADKYNGLVIIDIDPISTASVVNTIATPGTPTRLVAKGGYVYLAGYTGGLHIIDVDPYNTASIIKTIPIFDKAQDVALQGNYAYVAGEQGGLAIVDISTPASAFTANTVDTPGYACGVAVSGDYAYIADLYTLEIIDINPIASAYIYKEIPLPAYAETISITGNIAYITNSNTAENGLWIYQLW